MAKYHEWFKLAELLGGDTGTDLVPLSSIFEIFARGVIITGDYYSAASGLVEVTSKYDRNDQRQNEPTGTLLLSHCTRTSTVASVRNENFGACSSSNIKSS